MLRCLLSSFTAITRIDLTVPLARSLVRNSKFTVMKKSVLLATVLIFGLGMSSCSKCYTCQAPVEITTSSGTTTEYQEADFCTASPQELESKEADGYKCTNA